MGDINFSDAVNTRKAQKELMNQVRTKSINISSKYKVQTESFLFKWDKFISTFEK